MRTDIPGPALGDNAPKTFKFVKPSARGARRRVATLLAGALVGTVTLVVASTAPAYADATTKYYTIGTPSGAVTNVVATPSNATASASTGFTVKFMAGVALSGGSQDWITITPSVVFASAPLSVDLVGGSCIQAGTSGFGGAGSATATGITIELGSACSISDTSEIEIDFTADAPSTTGTFSIAVTTSKNSTAASSNDINVGISAPTLAAESSAPGANTTYAISDVPVSNLSSNGTSLQLTAAPTQGSGTISFLSSSNGSGYGVSVTPSGGTAVADVVQSASASGASVTLTLATPLADGDSVAVLATGTNPASSSTADTVTVTPGNGTPQTTSSILFGGSVTNVSVTPSDALAGATALYAVDFTSTDAVSAGGSITLKETTGPTGFASVSGILVTDVTGGWHFVASGPTLASGSATIPVSHAISAGDSISVVLANVTNPSTAQTVRDFTVATSGDPVVVDAVPYVLQANASAGVVVTVSPVTTGAVATYAISNVYASAALTGGTSTIQVQGPSGTVFPANASYYSVADSTTPSGSGPVKASVTGGGSASVTFTVPDNINAGDLLTITIGDVINPTASSSSDTITLVGNVTSTAPSGAPSPTTTVPAKVSKSPHATVTDLTSKATVVKETVDLKLRCASAACKGTVTLESGKVVFGKSSFSIKAGKTGVVAVKIVKSGQKLISRAKHHTLAVTAVVTVTGGKTVKEKTTLVG
ncbi:MAG TPA: hypothetical protein VL984_11925 [Acidimicrobiales bacterium]|nr:hypothetical protein [Acidimicrobiales bacterium]